MASKQVQFIEGALTKVDGNRLYVGDEYIIASKKRVEAGLPQKGQSIVAEWVDSYDRDNHRWYSQFKLIVTN